MSHQGHVIKTSMVFRLLVLVVFLFAVNPPSTAYAVSEILVRGQVTDSLTGEPIPEAYMEIKDSSYNSLVNINADLNGYYEISADLDAAAMVCATANFKESGDYFYTDHIYECTDISQIKESEMTVDFALQPVGIFTLQVFDQQGNRVKNSEVLSIINYNAYITDLSDLPTSGIFSTVEENTFRKEETLNELAAPAFYTPIQTPVILHILWDIPDFGRIILDLDNGGSGYLVEKVWDTGVLNFNYEAARSEVLRFARELPQYQKEGYTFSASIESDLEAAQNALNSGETHLNAAPPEMALAVADFNEALVTALRGQEALYLEKAKADIPKFRQGSLLLTIKDAEGNSISNAAVNYRQISHDFQFGGWYLTDGWNYLPEIGDTLADAGFNASSVMMSQKIIEPSEGQYDFSYPDTISGMDTLLSKGYSLIGGFAYYGHPDDQLDCPDYWDTMTFEEYKNNVYNHFKALSEHYQGRISYWMFNEQNLQWSNCRELNWEQKLDAYQSVMAGLQAGYPQARNIVASIALPYGWNQEKLRDMNALPPQGIAFPVYLDMLQERGFPLDAIGLEFYHFGIDIPGNMGAPGLNLASIARTMNLYNHYKLPVYITEFQVPSSQEPGTSWLHQPWDETTQAEFTRDFYTLAFGTESMQGVQWAAFASDKNSFLIHSGILDEEYQPKPVYYTLKDLIASWTTNGSAATDENGVLEIRGFAGDYEITVTQQDGTQTSSIVHICEQQDSQTEITTIPPDVDGVAAKKDWSIYIYVGLGILVIVIFVWLRKRKRNLDPLTKSN